MSPQQFGVMSMPRDRSYRGDPLCYLDGDDGYKRPPMTNQEINKRLVDGEPCGHSGCLSHVTHPCEGCGRIADKPIDINRRFAELCGLFWHETERRYVAGDIKSVCKKCNA